MCGVGRKKTKQASQRGTCQHSMPASHMEYSRAHNQHHMAGSLATTYFLQNQAGSRCMCGVGRKKTKQASQRGTCQHSMPASHMEYSRAHNQHHMAGSLATTYFLQNQAGSRCMCGVGRKKTKQAGQRGTCQHSRPASHIWATRAQNIHHMAGRNTHPCIEGTQQAPNGRQQADHSRAAESGGIQMHVWCWAKENKAGWSEGHMPA